MTHGRDPDYLQKEQYATDGNLRARIAVHERFSTSPMGFPRWMFNVVLETPAEAKVLEVGCGNGQIWAKCATLVPPGWELVLTDLSKGMIDQARRRLDTLPRAPEFGVADVRSLPFPEGRFDLVLANYMLYHVPDLQEGVRELARVLRPGGRLLAATNGQEHMREMDELEQLLGADPDREHRSFTCENGGEVLGRSFRSVRFLPCTDSLEITEAEAAVRYVLSRVPKETATPEALSALRREVERRIDGGAGRLHVTKDTGLFVASEPIR